MQEKCEPRFKKILEKFIRLAVFLLECMEAKEIPEILFPHDKIRKVQEDLLMDAKRAIEAGKHLIAHAPTGLGKTAATLAPALAIALKKDLTVFFLASRHTQHAIALKTLKEIRKKFGVEFNAVSIIGKKWMCAVPETESLFAADFADYCKAMRDDDKCEFYSNTKKSGKLTPACQKALKSIKEFAPHSVERISELCSDEKLCPYEVSMVLAAESRVIVTDYYYLLHPGIRETFLAKTGKQVTGSIVIIDEGHNLPSRAREILTQRMSNYMIKMAVKEARKYSFEDALIDLVEIQDIFNKLSDGMGKSGEKTVSGREFASAVEKIKDYDEIQAELEFAADQVRESEKHSYIGGVAKFLEGWKGPDRGFCRIMSARETRFGPLVTLMRRCLDPSMAMKEIISGSHSTIVMSGTLSPASMYRDLLGFPEGAVEKEYMSPFPEKNRLAIIVPRTTTKFTMRSPEQYKRIAGIVAEIVDSVPGNSAVFFPSYRIRDEVLASLGEMCGRDIIAEKPGAGKGDRKALLDSFMESDRAVLLGVAAGSFGEGIDIPNNKLKAVIVVGLPLDKPDLETNELIRYYDEKFGRGWDYGYIMPAVTKSLQNAGRCIRSETDRGLMVFLDERYAWPGYRKCFPKDWEIEVTPDFSGRISGFFAEKAPVSEKPQQ